MDGDATGWYRKGKNRRRRGRRRRKGENEDAVVVRHYAAESSPLPTTALSRPTTYGRTLHTSILQKKTQQRYLLEGRISAYYAAGYVTTSTVQNSTERKEKEI